MLTVQERKELYWGGLFNIIAFGLQECGICLALSEILEDDTSFDYFGICDTYYPERDLPELAAQKPVPSYNPEILLWFDRRDVNSRLEALEKAIALCDQQL